MKAHLLIGLLALGLLAPRPALAGTNPPAILALDLPVPEPAPLWFHPQVPAPERGLVARIFAAYHEPNAKAWHSYFQPDAVTNTAFLPLPVRRIRITPAGPRGAYVVAYQLPHPALIAKALAQRLGDAAVPVRLADCPRWIHVQETWQISTAADAEMLVATTPPGLRRYSALLAAFSSAPFKHQPLQIAGICAAFHLAYQVAPEGEPGQTLCRDIAAAVGVRGPAMPFDLEPAAVPPAMQRVERAAYIIELPRSWVSITDFLPKAGPEAAQADTLMYAGVASRHGPAALISLVIRKYDVPVAQAAAAPDQLSKAAAVALCLIKQDEDPAGTVTARGAMTVGNNVPAEFFVRESPTKTGVVREKTIVFRVGNSVYHCLAIGEPVGVLDTYQDLLTHALNSLRFK